MTYSNAPAPALPTSRGRATPGLLAHLLVAKYADHLPLYRQSEIYAREGVDLGRSTLCGWVGQTAWLLAPIVEGIRRHVFAADKIHGDDTTVPVLAPGLGRTKTGRLWVYVRDDRPFCGTAPPAAAYFYSADRGGEHPAQHLAGFSGFLQADGYAGFEALYRRGTADLRPNRTITEVACWAHCRRKFFDVWDGKKSPVAKQAIDRIATFYAIEAKARFAPPDERLAHRAETAPLLAAFFDWANSVVTRLSAKSELAEAFRYTLNRKEPLSRFLADARLEIGRVEVWRGCCRLNVSVAAPFVWRCLTGSTLAPSPHPARQTGHADFPHPAFSRPIRPSLSAGRCAAAGRCRGRASHRDTRLGSGGTQHPVAQLDASTSGGPFAPCMHGRVHRFL